MQLRRSGALRRLAGPGEGESAYVRALPAYQVALWPDGWESLDTGAIRVRDTHAMAEARRWYSLAERNRSGGRIQSAMRLHGVFVPRPIVDMAHQVFATEQAASVAVQLVAGDWVAQRRRQLVGAPRGALQERLLGWTGSRHGALSDSARLAALTREIVCLCIAERLIPDTVYRVEVQGVDGFGIPGFRCIVEAALERVPRDGIEDALRVALLPWNRGVVCNGRVRPLVGLVVRGASGTGTPRPF